MPPIYLTTDEVKELHRWAIEGFGGASGIRDEGMLDSAVHQPQAGFGGQEFYPDLANKAAAIGYSLVMNHPFVDGNKRVAYAAMATFLTANGCTLTCDDTEVAQVTLAVASGAMDREQFTSWVSGCAIYPPVS